MGSREARATTVVVDGPTLRNELEALCGRVHALLVHDDTRQIVLDVGALVDPDRATVDALARLQLSARRSGGRIRLCNPSEALRDMLALAGLDDELCA